MQRRIRASKDDEAETPLFQDPRFIIGLYFVGIVLIIIICLLIYKFISDRIHRTGALSSKTKASLEQQTNAYRQKQQREFNQKRFKRILDELIEASKKKAQEKIIERVRSYTL